MISRIAKLYHSSKSDNMASTYILLSNIFCLTFIILFESNFSNVHDHDADVRENVSFP